METKFNFNSQVCTDRFQSERLLALGLKKETADCCYYYYYYYGEYRIALDEAAKYPSDIPAWSLGRLWELYWSNKVVSDCLFGCGKHMNPYAEMIAMIEYDIEDGTFNKDYLDK